ncbi:hypothetical protein CYMTET_21930 [Cymbomonas tetramitiformis]|uniref:Uncharacterized protein n=1 Tax=Cymbomonas tetramitiformis TaxID=36881 RepID=A0AAE0G1U8_9CHLO|nr:hypothetical protein CYMTET_21930 [Cymbomonas tetramitiformis]
MLRTNYHRLLVLCGHLLLYLLWTHSQQVTEQSSTVVSSIERVFVPGDVASYATELGAPSEIISWLEIQVNLVWKDAMCGNGVCESPQEFPAFGPLGCKVDCGTEQDLHEVILILVADFTAHQSEAIDPFSLMEKASWNLCMRDKNSVAQHSKALCWFSEEKRFRRVREEVSLPFSLSISEDWYVRVSGDDYGFVSGLLMNVTGNGLAELETTPSWSACEAQSTAARRQMLNSAVLLQGSLSGGSAERRRRTLAALSAASAPAARSLRRV